MTEAQLQQLLRLKKHEHPTDMEGFTQDLIVRLRARRITEDSQPGVWSRIWEPVRDFYQSLSGPQTAVMAVSGAALILGVVLTMDAARMQKHSSLADVILHTERRVADDNGDRLDVSQAICLSPAFGADRDLTDAGQKMSPLLLSKHFVGGFVDEATDLASDESIQNRSRRAIEVMPFMKFADDPPEER